MARSRPHLCRLGLLALGAGMALATVMPAQEERILTGETYAYAWELIRAKLVVLQDSGLGDSIVAWSYTALVVPKPNDDAEGGEIRTCSKGDWALVPRRIGATDHRTLWDLRDHAALRSAQRVHSAAREGDSSKLSTAVEKLLAPVRDADGKVNRAAARFAGAVISDVDFDHSELARECVSIFREDAQRDALPAIRDLLEDDSSARGVRWLGAREPRKEELVFAERRSFAKLNIGEQTVLTAWSGATLFVFPPGGVERFVNPESLVRPDRYEEMWRAFGQLAVAEPEMLARLPLLRLPQR